MSDETVYPRVPGTTTTPRFTDVARSGEGAPCYRIPALAQLPDGRLLAAYDARPSGADLPSPIAVVGRWSSDGGRTWTKEETIRSAPAPHGFGDPSIVVDDAIGRILIFHVAAAEVGFFTGRCGLDPADPMITHPDVSISDDGGRSWIHRRLTAELREPDWAGMFAASGAGIRLRHGRYAGRLLQQYTVRIDQENYAVTAWSDDHGDSWQHSAPAGPGADENKVVELGDGGILLNCRATPCRTQARSDDGGATWSRLAPQPQLPDPGNNAAVIRAFPDAEPGTPHSRILLCSNTPDQVARRNLTVKVSYDDGATWPGRLLIHDGPAAYSTLINLAGGGYGLLFERDGYRALTYTRFGFDDLPGLDAVLEPQRTDVVAGQETTLPVRLSLREPLAEPATLELLGLPGWRSRPVAAPAGAETSLTEIPAAVPVQASGRLPVSIVLRSGDRLAVRDVDLTVAAAGRPTLDIVIEPVTDTVSPPDADGLRAVGLWVPVRNTGNVPAHLEVSLDGGGCVALDLAPGELGVARGPQLCRRLAPDRPLTVRARAVADGMDTVECSTTCHPG